MVVSVVPPNPIIIIILSPSREVRRERRAPIIKSTIHKFLSALSSPHGSRRLLPSSAASVVSRGPIRSFPPHCFSSVGLIGPPSLRSRLTMITENPL